MLRPRVSGAEILVSGMLTCGRSEWRAQVWALEPPEPSFEARLRALEAHGVTVRVLAGSGKLNRLRFLMRCIRETRPDLIFAHTVIPSFYCRVAALLCGSPAAAIVSVLHDAGQDDYRQFDHNLAESCAAPAPRAVVAVAPRALANYRRRFGPVAGTVIRNGVNLDAIAAQCRTVRSAAAAHRAACGLEGRSPIVLQVGRIARDKRQHLSVQAFANAALGSDAVLVFAGIPEDEDYRKFVMETAETCGVTGRVRWLGAVSDVAPLLAMADVFVMPSATEGFSVAFVEALAAGVPVVATSIPPFEFARGMPAVALVDVADITVYANAMARAAGQPGRPERDLSDLTLDATRSAYDRVASALAQSRAI